MDFLSAIDYREPTWIVIALVCGLLFKQIRLPPMVGFLAAGFVLHLFGAENDVFLTNVANLGVTLLLFTIGLKLQIRTLIRPEIWATAGLNMIGMIALTVPLLLILGVAGIQMFADLDMSSALIVAFALSFSSTVFAVKTLEDRGSMVSRYGRVAIGILVMQDVAAVIFLAASAGKIPSIWAVGLLALIPGRHLLGYILAQCGHRELIAVYGFTIALGGAAVFEAVGLKGDLGALIMGVLLAQHQQASELAKQLLGFKDVFLVCFFLTIGLTGIPSLEATVAAVILLVLLPLKAGLFVWLMTRFRLRARASTLGSLVLTNYSEFGLIVAAVAFSSGWLVQEWIVVLALAMSISFLISSPLNVSADSLYARYHSLLKSMESKQRLPGDEDIHLSGNRILIFGMGRVGKAAYDDMQTHAGGQILGVDLDESEVARNVEAGRNVVLGDGTHPEFWSRIGQGSEEIEIILLAMPYHFANMSALDRLRDRGYTGPIVATALYPDQEEELRQHGISQVFNLYAEAGVGAASHMRQVMDLDDPPAGSR